MTPKGAMLFGWSYVTKSLQKAFLWGPGINLLYSSIFRFALAQDEPFEVAVSFSI